MRSLNYHIKLRQVNSIKIFSTPIAPRPSVPRLELYPGELFRLWNVHTHIGKSHRSKLSVAKVRSLPGRCWKKVGKAQPNQAAFVSQLHTSRTARHFHWEATRGELCHVGASAGPVALTDGSR